MHIVCLLWVCRTSFKDVGKGWYNLAESNFEAYRFSKLRRFLGLVRLGMEDSLRYLVEGSIAKFVTFMQVLCIHGFKGLLCWTQA
jgi:dynein heavy chain